MIQSVLIADDHPIVRDALRLVLKGFWPDAAFREAETGEQARSLILKGFDASLITFDMQMPGGDGLSSLAEIRRAAPRAKLVVLSGQEDQVSVGGARALAADAYLFKSRPMIDVGKAIRRVVNGEKLFPTPAQPQEDVVGPSTALQQLTPAQHRVMIILKTGASNKEIAERLQLSEVTVKSHLTAGYRRLGVQTRAQALVLLQAA